MKSILDVFAESLEGWNGQHPSEPILKMVETLATDGQFDEITDVLNVILRQLNNPDLTKYVMGKVPLKVLHNFVYKQPGLDHQIIVDEWAKDGVLDTFKTAALRDGALGRTVAAFVSKVRALSENAHA